MNFPGIYGHEAVKNRLANAIENNRIPSAYLFLGQSGIGKSTLVKELAQTLNCESKTICHNCPNCQLFDSGSHPDFHVIERNGQFIRIGQIQELISQLNLKPAYATKRVVLVKDAERLNQESANSFLKTLEEPPLDTLIVLLSSDENMLLETILSRCQKILFSPLSREVLAKIIKDHYKLQPDEIEFVLNYSGGRIRKDFIQRATALNVMRHHVFTMVCSLETEQMVDHTRLIEQWVKKDLHEYFLEFCSTWLKDFAYLMQGKSEYITNQDLINEMTSQPFALTPEQWGWAFDLTIETESAIRGNAAKNLALESLIIQLKQVFAGTLVI